MNKLLKNFHATKWPLLIIYGCSVIVIKCFYWEIDISSCILCLTFFSGVFCILYWLSVIRGRTAILGCFFSLLYFLIIPLIACEYFFKDNTSYEFDEGVFKSEQARAMEELNKRYNVNHLMQQDTLIQELLNTRSPFFNIPSDVLIDKMVRIDSFDFETTKKAVEGANHPTYTYNFKISKNNNSYILQTIFSPDPPGRNADSWNPHIKSLLDKLNGETKRDIKNYKNRERQIKTGTFWTYSSLTPYFITAQNVKPTTRAANYLYFIHEKLFWGIILTFVLGIVLSKSFD